MQPLSAFQTDPVVLQGDTFHLRLPDGSTAPLFMGPGVPAQSFVPGWTASLLYSGFESVRVLMFEGPDGAQGSWVLDRQNVRIANAADGVPAEIAESLRCEALPMLQALLHDVMRPPVAVTGSGAAAGAIDRLDRALRTALAEGLGDALVAPARIVLADDLETATTIRTPDGVGASAMLRRPHVKAGFATTLQDRLVATTRDGALEWPSPVDGRVLQAQGCLYLDDFRLAYRFADTRHGVAFYVIASDHLCRSLGVYFPGDDLLIARDDWSRHLIQVYFPDGVARRIATHCVAWAPELMPYLAGGPTRIASVVRGPSGSHLGHHLWNELTGIETLLTHAAGPAIPDWIVPAPAAGTEMWGPIDRLFVELEGRVERGLFGDAAITAHLYANGLCAARVTGERVSAELRRRLRATLDLGPVTRELDSLLWQSRANPNPNQPAPPVIVLGLRVENRTITDLAGFCVRLAGFIAETWPGAVLVLDGHNALDTGEGVHGKRILSHGEAFAATTPLSIEEDIASQVRDAVANAPIHVEDTLDLPIADSLAWALLSDCFISIWGASLAKFRWVANKPGLVISSRANLLHRDDLHIYDAPRYMEDPTQLLLADPASVTDEPDAPRLVPVAPGNPFFANFRVDEDAIFDQFRAFVFEVMTASAAQPDQRRGAVA